MKRKPAWSKSTIQHGKPGPNAVALGPNRAEIVKAANEGRSLASIGAEHGCSRTTVARRLEDWGYPCTGKPGKPVSAVTLGWHDTELAAMSSDGLSPAAIGFRLNCSRHTVLRRLQALQPPLVQGAAP